MAMLHVQVVTPERPIHDDEAEFVVVPAHDGEVGILPRHARFLARLGAGVLRITRGGRVHRFRIRGGFVQVSDNRVIALCDHAESADEVDVAGAEHRAARAQRVANHMKLEATDARKQARSAH